MWTFLNFLELSVTVEFLPQGFSAHGHPASSPPGMGIYSNTLNGKASMDNSIIVGSSCSLRGTNTTAGYRLFLG